MAESVGGKRSLRQRLGLSRSSRKTKASAADDLRQHPGKLSLDEQSIRPSGRHFSLPEAHEHWPQRRHLSLDTGRNRSISTRSGSDAFSVESESNHGETYPRRKSSKGLHKELIDKDTGERKDLTDMMHAFTYDEHKDIVDDYHAEEVNAVDPDRPRGEPMLTKLSAEMWVHITDYLLPRESANLALSCKTALWLLGSRPFEDIALPSNRRQRIEFLMPMDIKLPKQLFCFPCAAFHTRTHPGEESLKPAGVLNPLFVCPNSTNTALAPPRTRITVGRNLPYTFVQLATRAHRFGPKYGISCDALCRRWRDPWSDWRHQTRYHVHKNGHLLMRVVSQVWAEGGLTIAAKRMLLYSREDYTPYFSACPHWQDGVLMDNCKCALDHIPAPIDRGAYLGGIKLPRASIVGLCSECLPMRRCPHCPSEYLIELKLVEDKSEVRNHPLRFKQAMVVTRWCDLGNGLDPQQGEWAAIQGERDDYDSFEEIGNRAISTIFESAFTDSYPNQRLLSLNPSNIVKGEEGNKWY